MAELSLTIGRDSSLIDRASRSLPTVVAEAGPDAQRRFVEFFVAHLRNLNTRMAYLRAAQRFFCWCEQRQLALAEISSLHISLYIEELTSFAAAPTVKQNLAALRMLGDWLVVGQVLKTNPASSVRGPRYSVKKGKTPVLSADEARELLESIDVSTVAGLRDRALIGVMIYSFARVGAVVAMNTEDYFAQGRRMWFRLHEKGGKLHDVPAHHKAEEYVDAYLDRVLIEADRHGPLFRSFDRQRKLTNRRIQRLDVLAMVKRRARQAGLPTRIGCHTFRATGITTYLKNGGTLEHAQRIANHESARTTGLYDRRSDDVSLDEIERIIL
ncbi:MAG: integrase [Planctomycetes bacterium]|nr:integrase [Planctomycetota bacterium]